MAIYEEEDGERTSGARPGTPLWNRATLVRSRKKTKMFYFGPSYTASMYYGNRHIRRAYTLLVLAIVLYTTYITNGIYRRDFQRNNGRHSPYKYVVRTAGCNITGLEPFDPTTFNLHRSMPSSICPGRPSFIQQKDNVLSIDIEALLVYYDATPADINCFYNTIQRFDEHPVADKGVLLKAKKPLRFGLPLQEEYILVTCKRHSAIVHREFFMFPLLMEQVQERFEKVRRSVLSGTEEFSVLVLGLGSVSRINSIRYLTETRKYLIENLQPIELQGYNAVGEDAFSNQIPILTGMPWTQTRRQSTGDFFDDLYLVWKLYAARGYRTMFIEESPIYGLFHYREKGFRHPPTDYYPRAPLLAMELLSLSKRLDGNRCYAANHTRIQMTLNYAVSVLSKNQYSFAYVWVRSAAQDDTAGTSQADLMVRDTFLELSQSGVLNRTVVLFLSDYGTRFGPVRRTLSGRYEHRLPFCLLIFPQTFRKKYPWALGNLELNQRRLTTPYDIHATLMELAMQSTSSTRTKFTTKYGISLLHEVPEKRTCKDASISPHWCSCGDTRTSPPSTRTSQKMSQFVVDTVNKWLVTLYPGKCHKHVLDEILSVEERTANGGEEDERYFWLTLRTRPRNVTLEGTVGVSGNGSFSLHGVSRIDAYTITCVSDRVLEMYCTCR